MSNAVLASGAQAHRRPPQCLKRPDRPPQAACRVFVLDLADLAAELGLPGCSVDDTVVDPLEGAVLPHPRVTGVRAGRPANGSGWVYPWQYEPHHQSHWAGPWCARRLLWRGFPLNHACSQCCPRPGCCIAHALSRPTPRECAGSSW